MSAFPESKLDSELVSKAVNALLKFEAKKAAEGSNGKALLVSNYAKPVLVQVSGIIISKMLYIYLYLQYIIVFYLDSII